MFIKGMNTREVALLLVLSAEKTAKFLAKDVETDNEILDLAVKQIETRVATLPSPDDRIVLTCSLTANEAERLTKGDEEFETHFLTILAQQTENTERSIVRFESGNHANAPRTARAQRPRRPVASA